MWKGCMSSMNYAILMIVYVQYISDDLIKQIHNSYLETNKIYKTWNLT